MAPVLKTGKAEAFGGSHPPPSASSAISSNPWLPSRFAFAVWRFERSLTGGARYAQGLKAKLSNWSQSAALDNPTPSASFSRFNEATCLWHFHCSYRELGMIRANCRARFTAADFNFVVRTLARSPNDDVSLVDLLSDAETRDSVLDHPRLVDAILSHAGHLQISSQFYFYVLARHVLQQAGITDRKLCDYIASVLETFSRANLLRAPHAPNESAHQYLSDMLIALTRCTPAQAFLLRAHVGNYSLFISGIFHENAQRRSLRGGPDLKFYEQVGQI